MITSGNEEQLTFDFMQPTTDEDKEQLARIQVIQELINQPVPDIQTIASVLLGFGV